ncbi:MAG: helix-turn-helix domain-containing protein [Clostridia bacterium]|jgi:transcriptional regulator with XRE-family HTH domain|nr:helix-turn-helix domain-containing protein [Clostridia bacterium]
MDKLSIGEVIFKLRKEKNITQNQLGKFIGVSTAAVSKWESGISYPDITLLPILAIFFNVTIDELLNFKIELSDEEVMKIFRECESIFSSGNLDKAMDKSKEYILKYPSSYYLKFRIGFLFTIYSWKGDSDKKCMDMIGQAIDLFEEVAKNCVKVEVAEQALFQLGALYPSIGEEDKAIEALNKISKSEFEPNSILANIYLQKGDVKKARELFQNKLYKSIFDISLSCMGLANSYVKSEKDVHMVEKYYNLSINIKEALSADQNTALSLSTEYLHLAIKYLQFKEKNKALDALKKMLKDMENNDINKPRKVNSVWCFNEISSGERTVTMNLYENIYKIFEQQEFDLIRDNEVFVGIINDLKELEKKSLK